MRRVLSALMIGVLVAATPIVDARPAPAEAPPCSGASDPIGKTLTGRPVVIVHGWADSADGPDIVEVRTELDEKLGDANAVLRFDYSTANTVWAADDLVAQCLAEYIAQASAAYGSGAGDGQVVVVGHSMGGLAARFAAMKSVNGKPVSAMIRGIITIDTPSEGSPFGGIAALIREALLPRAKVLEQPLWNEQLLVQARALRVFIEHPDAGVCLADANTRAALLLTQCEMPDDTARSAGIPVLAIATHVRFQNGFFGLDWGTSDSGWDGIVANTSALAYSNTVTRNGQTFGGTATFPCATPVFDVPARLRQLGVDHPWINVLTSRDIVVRTAADATALASKTFAILSSACWHVAAPRFPDVVKRVVEEIGKLNVVAVGDVDWANQQYRLTCAGVAPASFRVNLRGGSRVVPGHGNGDYERYEIHLEKKVIGTLAGVATPVAAVLIQCSPQPSNYYVEEVQVFSDGPEWLGELPELEPLPDAGPLRPVYDWATGPNEFMFNENGELVTGVWYYSSTDSHASGPSIHRVLRWRWDGKRFVTAR